jgi:hypothetical protein
MTAVEWLYKNLLENPISNQDIKYNEAVFHNAKEMEKHQIMVANTAGVNNGLYGYRNAEQYYNETFKKK